MNPYSVDMMRTYYTYKALKNLDENCAEYIANAASFAAVSATTVAEQKSPEEFKSELQHAIIKGFKEKSAAYTDELLRTTLPLDIVKGEIIPALNIVGEGFEKKTLYLPQLLMSAEAAKSAFDVIKAKMASSGGAKSSKETFVIATVHGDIHDIGKNIVRLLLENYGYNVIDLGRDVSPEKIAECVIAHKAPFVGLSALMTTTVPAMEETITLLRREAPFCKILVGGAVLTKEYADSIGADKYAKDAMEAVRYCEEFKA